MILGFQDINQQSCSNDNCDIKYVDNMIFISDSVSNIMINTISEYLPNTKVRGYVGVYYQIESN